MEEFGIPEYEDYFKMAIMEDEDLINFMYTMDDKKSSIEEIEDGVMKVLVKKDTEDIQKFYEYHIDLFVRYQPMFSEHMKHPEFLFMKYMKWRTTVANLETYFNGLKMHHKMSLPTSPQTPLSPPKSASSPGARISSFFEKYTRGSVFAIVDPVEFARVCHKLFVYYYFLAETRYFHYVSRHNTELRGYASELIGLCNNFLRKMEYEVELYCIMGNITGLVDAFTKMTTTFLELGNVPFGEICISLIERFKICKLKRISEYQSTLKSIKSYNKYKYFVSPDAILRAFIRSNEMDNKSRLFMMIYDKLLATKRQLMEMEELKMQPDGNDFVVYNYLQPTESIKEQLYMGKGEIECLKEKCKN